MDSVKKRRPAVLRRGCGLKKIRGVRKTLAQVSATRRMMPA